MAKISKFKEKAKKVKRTDVVCFNTDDGEVVEFAIESRSQDQMDALNSKYQEMSPKVPTKRLPAKNGQFKIVDDTDNKEYKKEMAKVTRLHFAEMALMFLAEDERPEGELKEQIEEILSVELAGFISKIVNRGLEISGLKDEKTYEEEIDEAKND